MPNRQAVYRRIAVVIALLAFGVLAGGCAQQAKAPRRDVNEIAPSQVEARRLTEMSLDLWVARTIRLQRISQRLRINGREVCQGALAPVLGVAVQRIATLPDPLKDVAHRRYGTKKGVVVLSAFTEMSGNGNGLQAGDILLALGDRAVDEIADLNRPLDSPTRVDLRRDGVRLTIEIEPVTGCRFPAMLTFGEYVNAFANGELTSVTTALMREFADDTLLAAVVGHELAHNLLDRVRPRHDIARRAREARADHVGIYLTVLGGFPITEKLDLYIKLESDLNLLATRSRSHPAPATREARYQKTIEQIRQQQDAGLPLLPEF